MIVDDTCKIINPWDVLVTGEHLAVLKLSCIAADGEIKSLPVRARPGGAHLRSLFDLSRAGLMSYIKLPAGSFDFRISPDGLAVLGYDNAGIPTDGDDK